MAGRAFLSRGALALYAGLIALSSFGIFIFTRINIPDALVCLLLTAALLCYLLTEEQSGRRWGCAVASRLCWR